MDKKELWLTAVCGAEFTFHGAHNGEYYIICQPRAFQWDSGIDRDEAERVCKSLNELYAIDGRLKQ